MNAESIIQSDINDGIINGAAVLVGGPEQNLFERGYGFAVKEKQVPMTVDSLVDIASVTKVLTATTALLICHDRGLIDFDAPFTDYLPDFSGKLFKKTPTVRELAAHTSGFGTALNETQRPYFAESGVEIMDRILRYPPVRPPGEKVEYACWNFLLLGLIVERITGETLTQFCEREIFKPLEMSDTSMGRPVTDDPDRLSQTILTEKPGQISDYIAFRVFRDGGSCGNAGAFSSARDLAKFCRCILNHGDYGHGKKLFSAAMLQEITTGCTPVGECMRGFGWVLDDKYAPAVSSRKSILHSGWSGQTIYIDFGKKLFVVVLTIRCGDYDRAKSDRLKIIDCMLDQYKSK